MLTEVDQRLIQPIPSSTILHLKHNTMDQKKSPPKYCPLTVYEKDVKIVESPQELIQSSHYFFAHNLLWKIHCLPTN